jgi:DNA-binding response OmpR family regulator
MPKKSSIYIIEDDPMISQMYQIKLEASGYDIKAFLNGMEGLEFTRENPPDLLLLDIMLPQLDGFSILKELRASPKTKEIPIIILTNLGTDEDKKKGKEYGATDYIVKANFTPAEVQAKIEQYMK